jgi:hypothetical protein
MMRTTFSLLLTAFALPLAGSVGQISLTIEANSALEAYEASQIERKRIMRSEQTRRTTSTTTFAADQSQLKPNKQLCKCNGCFRNGTCHSIWFAVAPTKFKCERNAGEYCVDRQPIWEAGFCSEAGRRINAYRITLISEVTLTVLPNASSQRQKVKMTGEGPNSNAMAFIPCQSNIPMPDQIQQVAGKAVAVQGYFVDDPTAVSAFLAEDGVALEYKNNASYFVLLSIQDTTSLADDKIQRMQDQGIPGQMAGALKLHWTPQMSIVVVLVTCPDATMSADPEKIRQAFFVDFATAISAASQGQITVTGDMMNVSIPCPLNASAGDVNSYYTSVSQQLGSDPVWARNQYKAMVIPNGWMSSYGLAYSPGKLSWYSDYGGQDVFNIMHEMGHNMGLDRAGIIPSNNANGYDAHGDCASAMSKCGNFLMYSLGANWFLGFNTFQQSIDIDTLFDPVSINVASHSQQAIAGVLLTKNDLNGKPVPTYTISYVRAADAPFEQQIALMPWTSKVHIHQLPRSAYGPSTNIAILGSSDWAASARTSFTISKVSLIVTLRSQAQTSAFVTICKSASPTQQSCP